MDDPMSQAQRVFEAVVEGHATMEEAASALAEIDVYRPKSMFDPELEAQEDPIDRLYGDAANCYKMAFDALQSNEPQLARSYVKVARIKLDKAREEGA